MCKTYVFWSCSGADVSELSFGTAELLAAEGKTLIAELPCLGIPRLGFAAGVMDRGRNTEAALISFEQKDHLRWDMLYPLSRRLAVLAASVFAVPDCPAAAKLSFDTLMGFVGALQALADQGECRQLILDCQGQLISPMTFFSLKAADQVVIPLPKPTDAAYALAAVSRLVQVYRQPAAKFVLAVAGDLKGIERMLAAKSKEEAGLAGLRVCAWDRRKVKAGLQKYLTPGRGTAGDGQTDGSSGEEVPAVLDKDAAAVVAKDSGKLQSLAEGCLVPAGRVAEALRKEVRNMAAVSRPGGGAERRAPAELLVNL